MEKRLTCGRKGPATIGNGQPGKQTVLKKLTDKPAIGNRR
jgi:hypothetical protein